MFGLPSCVENIYFCRFFFRLLIRKCSVAFHLFAKPSFCCGVIFLRSIMEPPVKRSRQVGQRMVVQLMLKNPAKCFLV